VGSAVLLSSRSRVFEVEHDSPKNSLTHSLTPLSTPSLASTRQPNRTLLTQSDTQPTVESNLACSSKYNRTVCHFALNAAPDLAKVGNFVENAALSKKNYLT
jgi:hypothetical protein